jgi:hypothetical protein
MEARVHSRHIVAIAALLIFSFVVTVFYLSSPIADASVGHTNVSTIGGPPFP